MLGFAMAVICLAAAAAPTPLRTGALTAPHIRFQYAVYYLPKPTAPPLPVLQALLGVRTSPPTQLTSPLPKAPRFPVVTVAYQGDFLMRHRPPPLQALQYDGHGLSTVQAHILQGSGESIVLDFTHPASHLMDGMRAANELIELLAVATGGVIGDAATGEVFSPSAWREKRLYSFKGPWPDVSSHINIVVYEEQGVHRAFTAGMAKFGLPDVAVQKPTQALPQSTADLLNALAQALVEGDVAVQPGRFDLNFRSIKNDDVRKTLERSLKPGSTGVAELSLTEGLSNPGGPGSNSLVEIGFDRYPGADHRARSKAAFASVFGPARTVPPRAIPPAEWLRISARAQARLPGLESRFSRGLALGEYLHAYARFKTPTGETEFLWFEVQSWKGKTMAGNLLSEPEHVPALRSGQAVQVDVTDVREYSLKRADGSRESSVGIEYPSPGKR